MKTKIKLLASSAIVIVTLGLPGVSWGMENHNEENIDVQRAIINSLTDQRTAGDARLAAALQAQEDQINGDGQLARELGQLNIADPILPVVQAIPPVIHPIAPVVHHVAPIHNHFYPPVPQYGNPALHGAAANFHNVGTIAKGLNDVGDLVTNHGPAVIGAGANFINYVRGR